MSKDLREEFSAKRNEALETVKKAKEEDRPLTDEEKAKNKELYARCETINSQLEEETRFNSLKLADVPQDVKDFAKGNPVESKAKIEFDSERGGKYTADRHHKAINNYIRTGQGIHQEYTVVSGAGGVTMPSGPPVLIKRVANPYKAALQYFGLQVLNAPGAANIPILNDSANSADIIAQDNTSENSKDPVVTNLTGDVLYDSGSTWFSNTYLAQVDFDPLSYFRPALDARIEASETLGWTTAVTGAATTGVTTASTTGITWQELLALKYSLPTIAQQDGVFFVSAGLMQLVEGLADNNNRPIYRESLSDDSPNKLFNWPVFVVANLSTPAAGNTVAIAASASSLIAREFGPRRLVRYENIPNRPDQIGVREFANGGFGTYLTNVKLMKMHT